MREKHRFAAGKKHRNGKKNVWQQEKNALQREKAVSAAEKNASKKCRFAAGKIQSSRKSTLQQHKSTFAAEKNAFWRQQEKTARGGKKPVRGEKKTGRGRKKTSNRESPALQPKKVAATEKIHFRNGKKQQPGFSLMLVTKGMPKILYVDLVEPYLIQLLASNFSFHVRWTVHREQFLAG